MDDKIKICRNCGKEFTRDDLFFKLIELHGDPETYGNRHRYGKSDDRSNPFTLVDRTFKRKKYCSQQCQYEATTLKKYKEKRQEKINELMFPGEKPTCERCGYSETIDIHHIKQRRDGGKNSSDNLIILCPNCHALFHRGIINQDELIKLKQKDVVEVVA